jgi:hypothetical protein
MPCHSLELLLLSSCDVSKNFVNMWAEMPNRSKQLVVTGVEYKETVEEACSVVICWLLVSPLSCAHAMSMLLVLDASNCRLLKLQACSYPRSE